MLYLRNAADRERLSNEFYGSLDEVPGTECLRSRQETFTIQSRHQRDNYRQYHLTAEQAALLLCHLQIPYLENLRVQRTCDTVSCVNADHFELLTCKPGGATSTNRVGRIYTARTPEELFPPRMLRPMSPRGHACSGVRNHNSVITEKQAESILRSRYIAKKTYFDIAVEEGLVMRSVVSVCNGHNQRAVAQRLLPELIAGALGSENVDRSLKDADTPHRIAREKAS